MVVLGRFKGFLFFTGDFYIGIQDRLGVGSGRVVMEMGRGSNVAGNSHCVGTFEFLQGYVFSCLHSLLMGCLFLVDEMSS